MKIKIITPRADHAEAWTAALASSDSSGKPTTILQPLHAVNVLVNGSRPDLVVAETHDDKDLAALEALAHAHPEIDYVLVSANQAPESLLRMMRAGVREVLPAPATVEALLAAVQRLQRKRAAAAPAVSSHQSQVFSFISCKGGSGATFVAANLAHVLAAGGKRRVALIDLNLQFGDAALFVSTERPASNVADVARKVARLDRELLQSAMLPAAPGLWVLAAPEDPSEGAEVQAEHVQAIIRQAREVFDFVVVDVGRSLSAVTLQALDLSDKVFAVLQLTLPFIRDGKRLNEVFRSLEYPTSKIQWIVNRYQKGDQITLEDLKRTLGISDLVALPNQYSVVAASVNQGQPVASLAANSPITKALRDFADTLAPAAGKDAQQAGWLSGLFRSGGRGKGVEA